MASTAPTGGTAWRHSDVAVAAVVITIAAAALAMTFTFDKVPEALMQGLGAEIFPRLVLTIIGILAGILAFQARGRTPEPHEAIHPMVYATTATMVAFFVSVWLIGMLPSMFAFLVGVGWMWGERRLMLLIASAAVSCLFIWLVFVKLFGIALPHSILSERFF
jgi:hypothetical protein